MSLIVDFLRKHWKKVFGGIGIVGATLGSFFFGADWGRRKTEKKLYKYKEALRQHEIEIMALESKRRKSLSDRRQLKVKKREEVELKQKVSELEYECDHV